MAKVVPFRATHYDTSRYGKDVMRFVAPPYDVIDAPMEKSLKEDRLNIAHVTLGEQEGGYAIAAKRLGTWLADGVMVKDQDPAFYLYEQTFKSPDGDPRVRTGIVGLVRLEEFSDGIILPHERTIPKHKADRLKLRDAVKGDTEQIFLLYDDVTGEIEGLLRELRKKSEILRFVDTDGVHHRVVRVDDHDTTDRLSRLMGPKKLLIADGHHRYETALAYRDIRNTGDGGAEKDRPWDYVMATLVSFENPGLVIYPTHRALSGLEPEKLHGLKAKMAERFTLEDKGSPQELAEAAHGAGGGSFGAWAPEGRLCALASPMETPEDLARRLSVVVLEEEVLKGILGYTQEMIDGKQGIEYFKDLDAAIVGVEAGEQQACFFVGSPTAHEIMSIAQSGRKLPQKSSYFFPKIWSGTLLYLH